MSTSLVSNTLGKREVIQEFHSISQNPHIPLLEKIKIIQHLIEKILTSHTNLTTYRAKNYLTAKGLQFILQKKKPKDPPLKSH
ncbi:MAG: hypothetical protein WCP39_00475 [Chlamydiota bacterium]